jgi:hypothetical protein
MMGKRARRPVTEVVKVDERLACFLASCGLLTFLAIVPAATAHIGGNYDSFSYTAPPTLSSGRLPLVPLVYELLGESHGAISVAQALVGAACWALLLWELSYVPSRVARLGLMAAVLWIACSTYVVNWYAALLSESLSISLLVLVIALLARWQRTGSGLWAVTIAASLWAWARSTSAYVVALVGVVAVVYSAVAARRHLVKASFLLGVGLFATAVSGQGQLWEQPFLHSMSERILPHPALTGWFASRGMPLSHRLKSLAGPYTTTGGSAYYHDPALASFRSWMSRSGKVDFTLFLITHPGWMLHGTFSGHEELSPRLIGYYGGGVSRPWLPAGIRHLFLTYRQGTLVLIGLADLVALGVAAARRSWTSRAYLWLGMVGLGLLTLIIDWAGDSWEVGRHSVEGTIATALAGLMLIASLQLRLDPPAEPEQEDRPGVTASISG